MQDRSSLYLKTRAKLRDHDPSLSQLSLASLTRACIEQGLVLMNSAGDVIFCRKEHQSQ